MAELTSKASLTHSYDAATDLERPLKKPRVDQELEQDYDDYSEEPVRQTEEIKASDLYLDTARQSLTLILKKSAPYLYQTSIYMGASYADHHVFINLETTKVYVLPDGYPVADPSLDDIAFVLAPKFTRSTVANLSSPAHLEKISYDLQHESYLSGYVGLNNIKRNDHMNVVIHALLHIPPLRDYLLISDFRAKESELLKRFAALAKKIWNPRLFKSQEVNRASGGKFRLEEQGDPVEFLGWLLNRLHKDLGGTKKRNSSIIFSTFQGELRAETQQVLIRPDSGENEKPRFDIDRDIKSTVSPFLFLAVDLPPPPLFQDSHEKNIIPQVGIHSVLSKYDGTTTQESAGQLRRYKCQKLPRYIILHFKRFTKNIFVEEKNPTIINFPLRGLDFRDYVDAPMDESNTLYDLIANVTHESVAGTTRDKENTVWKVHLRAAGGGGDNEKWFMIQDLIVEETRKEMIFLGETVIQIWERRSSET
ncbi:hypothetical protein D9756_005833 [Leucocoprinus leucothites]|uniref:USP domain-containing protein n=1 Tax=Leucocoprinus leucothites TaxID=201217 RepID=A0A8H5D2W3_9AGAR|nr:hypothetical protein D9756_005833 [Leucoagaricus leucothites]